MDLTKEYQNMLKAAPEIQTTWSPNIGDYYLWNDSLSVIGPTQFETATCFEIRDNAIWGDKNEYGQYIIGYFKEWVIMDFKTTTQFKCEDIIKQFQEIYTSYKDAFWLPRQDQLQDILNYTQINDYIYELYAWSVEGPDLDSITTEYCSNFSSMEQLWLAFVMHEKFNKKWIKNEWVKQ